MPILAIRGNRIQLNKGMNIIFGIQLMERHVLAFKGEETA